MFDAAEIANRRLLEADLLTGAVELGYLAAHGVPEARKENFVESPASILDRLTSHVEPCDLSPAAALLWARLQSVWKHKRSPLTWQALEVGASEKTKAEAAWMREYGLGMGLHAPGAAHRLLLLAQARTSFTRAQAEAETALEAARAAVRGL